MNENQDKLNEAKRQLQEQINNNKFKVNEYDKYIKWGIISMIILVFIIFVLPLLLGMGFLVIYMDDIIKAIQS
ncbi:hypothetical protein KZO60_05615 [Prevotella nanceiensis]|uniref:hypothetical protein n=1 Tax=Hoylesella nanceiensis TaxID=425941 RepID=UPI001C601CCF|nr:hypothetical protein [Hoylesella nanceiensis]MBW4767193.1 hypothetical protein [Hoylesella nanceiensis]DAX55190.1 MAG TPA: protein of unknown function (DUF334) [Microviridae sp.]